MIQLAYVQHRRERKVYVDMDMAEGILPPNEQMPNEQYRVNDRIGYTLPMSKRQPRTSDHRFQTHPGLVKRLFEREVWRLSAVKLL